MGFSDPVSLVGEVQQLAGHAAALQGGEGGQALRINDAEITAAVDDQHGRLPVLNEIDRILFFVRLGILPRRAEVVPLGEPYLLGVKEAEPFIERSGVRDKAFEPVGPVARDPVDHVPAERSAQRGGTIGVHPGVLLGGGRQSLAEVFQRLAAPVAADRVAEGLAVSG